MLKHEKRFTDKAIHTEATRALGAQSIEARKIALNTPSVFGYNADWEIVQETILYDTLDTIVGYCFDVQSMSDNTGIPVPAYVIVNPNEKGFPIRLFGMNGVSAYYGRIFDKAYYLGVLGCYIEVHGDIINPSSDEVMSGDELIAISQKQECTDALEHASSILGNAQGDYYAIRRDYLYGIAPIAIQAQEMRAINDVPRFHWKRGSVPTIIAMLIAKRFQFLNIDTLAESLATLMGTSGSGCTDLSSLTPGITVFFNSYGNSLAKPKTNKWNNIELSTGLPVRGLLDNSASTFKTSIDTGFPVGVSVDNGFDMHMMAGIGYSFGIHGNFITCYTTNIADGAVSLPLLSEGFSNHAWFLLKW